MKHLILRQLETEAALRVAERVAKSDIRNAVNQHAELQNDGAGGNLLLHFTGRDAGADPRWQGGRIKAQLFHAVTTQHRREAQLDHA